MKETTTPRRFIRLPEVLRRVGLGRSSVYAAVASGDFPKPIRIGPRATAWEESSIDNWMEERIAKARGAAA